MTDQLKEWLRPLDDGQIRPVEEIDDGSLVRREARERRPHLPRCWFVRERGLVDVHQPRRLRALQLASRDAERDTIEIGHGIPDVRVRRDHTCERLCHRVVSHVLSPTRIRTHGTPQSRRGLTPQGVVVVLFGHLVTLTEHAGPIDVTAEPEMGGGVSIGASEGRPSSRASSSPTRAEGRGRSRAIAVLGRLGRPTVRRRPKRFRLGGIVGRQLAEEEHPCAGPWFCSWRLLLRSC